MKTASDPIQHHAAALRQAARERQPIAPLREAIGDNEAAVAYAIQEINTKIALDSGRRLLGRKIGLTAKAVQHQLGVDQPDYGMLFADMLVGDGEPIAQDRVIQPRVEAEIALVLDRDLDAPEPSVADVIRAVGYCLPAIEIVDSRIKDWDIRLSDTIADNASSGLFVLGETPTTLDRIDLRLAGMVLERAGVEHILSGWNQPDGICPLNHELQCARFRSNGTASGSIRSETALVVSMGVGAACLGSPLHAARWLAGTMHRVGRPLQAGDVVMTGALGPMVAAGPGDIFDARIAGLGGVRAVFA